MSFYTWMKKSTHSYKTDIILVNEEHRVSLNGDRSNLIYSDEIRANLSLAVGYPVSLPQGNLLKYVITFHFGCGMFWTVSGVLIIITSIILCSQASLDTSSCLHTLPVFLFYFIIGIALISGLGYTYLMNYYLVLSHAFYVDQLYSDLINQGGIVHGKVVSIKKLMRKRKEIIYRFSDPVDGNDVHGKYITTTKTDFSTDNNVAILFLSQKINILL